MKPCSPFCAAREHVRIPVDGVLSCEGGRQRRAARCGTGALLELGVGTLVAVDGVSAGKRFEVRVSFGCYCGEGLERAAKEVLEGTWLVTGMQGDENASAPHTFSSTEAAGFGSER